jgi:FAD/FMN-containing dehydrogenase
VLFHADASTEGEAELQPLLDVGAPFFAAVGPQPYSVVPQSFDAGLPARQRYDSRAHYLAGLTDVAIDTIIAHAPGLAGAFTVAYLEPVGGAAARVDPEATAFAHRDAAYSFHILAGWPDAGQDEEVMAWAGAFHNAMASHSMGGVYVNLLGSGEEDRVRAAYGDNYERLVALKQKWDPDNLFRMNHNIQPAA